ncbi:uncharacterized protein EDB91DRAFT_737112 [Suillus paluster]|uniref:uncharacterized protein n=1 Tax=Suillus paluster TaxID=48578 RepID=UPI001B8859E0|nr:uncharacterized protein EDB91DRAFT_737112 [Suillus paluster]KAG1730948.1 hypothetical protein EDB91DRAFT_737112 [Suillus paluster]
MKFQNRMKEVLPKLRFAIFENGPVTHGFFAWMGGFMLYVNDKPRATLHPNELLNFVRKGSMDMPVITETEIEDRSKGDGLSKGIAILQLVWFVLQLVARYTQNLPITLLEVDTLAVSALTCITYCLWWKKPKDVGCPYTVHLKTTASPPSNLAYDNDDIQDVPVYCDCCPYFVYLVYPITSLMGIRVTISPRAARSRRVPSLGGYGEYHGHTILLIGCFCGMVFGGIHCLGWNFLFHRQTEQLLWRAASLMIMCSPVPILLFSGIILSGIDKSSVLIEIIGNSLFVASIISILIYITARVTLIVLMILSLQSLPSGVYNTVAWTKFFPHL